MLSYGMNNSGLYINDGVWLHHNSYMMNNSPVYSFIPRNERFNFEYSSLPFDEPQGANRGFIAVIKKTFAFIETVGHDEQVFFHFGNYVGNPQWLELGQEVGYTISAYRNLPAPGNCLPARKVFRLPKGSIPQPAVLESVHSGVVARPMRCINPEQREYAGLIKVFDEGKCIVLSQHEFGITSLIRKRALPQKGDLVRFRIDEAGRAAEVNVIRPKLRATVDSIKGQFGFLNYEIEEGKKLFFNMSEVHGTPTNLHAGDTAEFSVITNQRNGKSLACDVLKINTRPDISLPCENPDADNSMPQNENSSADDVLKISASCDRLMSGLKFIVNNSMPRPIATRALRGQYGRGFLPYSRNPPIPGILPE